VAIEIAAAIARETSDPSTGQSWHRATTAVMPFRRSSTSALRLEALAVTRAEAVDSLASAVRAGLSLPDAPALTGERGPASLRGPFTAFGANYQANGRFPSPPLAL
jgi:Flp pilus assembly protein TadB